MCVGSRTIGLTVMVASWLASASTPARAQGTFTPRVDLSDAILVDEADAATRTHLERAKAFIADEQWDEAVEILRQVTESHGGKVLPVSPWRFVSVRDYCHLQIASLPPAALELYRSRVDDRAQQWYEDGLRRRDAGRLRDVVDQLFCSTWGDDALLALGDLALEAGSTGEARGYWEKILPPDYWARLAPAVVQTNGSPVWLLYPDSDLDRAAVRARLLLAIILDGDLKSARQALEPFRRECGAAEGKLGGRRVKYAEFLEELLSESSGWPAEKVDRQWPTFAGSPQRDKVAPGEIAVGPIAWEEPLPETAPAEAGSSTGPRRIAEARDQLLSYHPVVVDNLVLVSTFDEIRAYDLASGKPMWSDSEGQAMYRLRERGEDAAAARFGPAGVGAPRFTLTVRQRRVYARLGSPVTTRTSDQPFMARQSYLVCVDLDLQGKCLWATPDTLGQEGNDPSWAFEGSPLVDGDGVYVVMRRSGVRPQQYVACLHPETGRLKWRRLVCGAETPGMGQEEMTHNLLTLDANTLYCNTNLGAVAALSTRDGQIRWITRYPRTRQLELTRRPKHLCRDLTPCVYHHGIVYVAPADSELLLALDAPTGLLIWPTPFPEDVVHLLGVVDGKLVASGDKLWWIDTLSGKIVSPPGTRGAVSFPEGGSPKGIGRGLLAGDRVYWPTWDKIYVFDHKTNRQLEPINLGLRHAAGGNLVPAGDSLIIAGHDRLTVFRAERGPHER